MRDRRYERCGQCRKQLISHNSALALHERNYRQCEYVGDTLEEQFSKEILRAVHHKVTIGEVYDNPARQLAILHLMPTFEFPDWDKRTVHEFVDFIDKFHPRYVVR